MQTPKQSVTEVITSVLIGYVIAWATWMILIWALYLPIGTGQSAFITAVFTALSFIRQYIVRRWFNRRHG